MIKDLTDLKNSPEDIIFFWDGSAMGDHSKAAAAICAVDKWNRLIGTFWLPVIQDPRDKWFVGAERFDNVSAEFTGAIFTFRIIIELCKNGFQFNSIILSPDLDLIRDFLNFKSRIKTHFMKRLASKLMELWGDLKELVRIRWKVVKGHTGIYGNEIVNSLAQFALTHPSIAYTQFCPPWLPGHAQTYGEGEMRNLHRRVVRHPLVPTFLFVSPNQSCGVRSLLVSPLWLGVIGKEGAGSYRLGGESATRQLSLGGGNEPADAVLVLLRIFLDALGKSDCRVPQVIVVRISCETFAQYQDIDKAKLRIETLLTIENIRRISPILFS